MDVIKKRISQKSDTLRTHTHITFEGFFWDVRLLAEKFSWFYNGSQSLVIMIESDLLRADFVAEIGPTFLSFGSAQAGS